MPSNPGADGRSHGENPSGVRSQAEAPAGHAGIALALVRPNQTRSTRIGSLAQAFHAIPPASSNPTDLATSDEQTDDFIETLVVFEPETLHAMIKAFVGAWKRVRDSGHICAGESHAAETRLKLAGGIIALAAKGELDPIRLRDHALDRLFPLVLQLRDEDRSQISLCTKEAEHVSRMRA